jgi:hypothetical protein
MAAALGAAGLSMPHDLKCMTAMELQDVRMILQQQGAAFKRWFLWNFDLVIDTMFRDLFGILTAEACMRYSIARWWHGIQTQTDK